MAFAILRIAKLKKAGLHGSSSHVTRERETPNADPSIENVQLLGRRPVDDVLARVEQIAEARSASGARKLRSDAVLAVEHMLTASPEFFDQASPDEVLRWAQASVSFLGQRFGDENIVNATLHLDEKTPHIHAYHVPVGTDAKGVPTLTAKKLYGGPKELGQLQTDYHAYLRSHGIRLDRGLARSRATHQDVQKFYGNLKKDEKNPAPSIKVDTPPRLITTGSREEWALKENRKIYKKLKKMSGVLSRAIKAYRYWRREALQAKERAKAYAALGLTPDQLKTAVRDAREAAKLRESLAEVKAVRDAALADSAIVDRLEQIGLDRRSLATPRIALSLKALLDENDWGKSDPGTTQSGPKSTGTDFGM